MRINGIEISRPYRSMTGLNGFEKSRQMWDQDANGSVTGPSKYQPATAREAWEWVGWSMSDRNTGPTSLHQVARYIALAWEFGSNPLPALRKRLAGRDWTCTARCWATHPVVDGEDCRFFEQLPHLRVGATTVVFHPVDQAAIAALLK
jgi:hypothetical protein